MNEKELRDQIELDLREAASDTVIYLEGKTDPDILFGLLGVPIPRDGIHRGVLVKGLRDSDRRKGSGSGAVINRVDVATRFHLEKVIGVIDGDGRPLGMLAPYYDPPYGGPLFRWKAYCIENLLARAGWPPSWGTEPDWQAEMSKYGPSVALNRIGLEARSILKDLGLERYSNPGLGDPPRSATDISVALAAGKARLLSFDVERRFLDELAVFAETVSRSIDETHALLNGKWLVRHMGPTITRRDPDQCQFDWIAHARSTGGLPEVREWWERVTGFPP